MPLPLPLKIPFKGGGSIVLKIRPLEHPQGCYGQGKYLENEIFSRSGKSQGILLDSQGNLEKDLESQGNVREFENKWLWQAVFRKFVQEGKGCSFQ